MRAAHSIPSNCRARGGAALTGRSAARTEPANKDTSPLLIRSELFMTCADA
jgi:hypothetical protein